MTAGKDTHGHATTLAEIRTDVVERLRARGAEIEEAIFARIRDGLPDPAGSEDREPESGHPVIGKGCSWHLSEEPSNYRLVGVEQGLEGWDGFNVIGGYGSNLQLYTAYTPRPPVATTSAPSEVQHHQATLNGNVETSGLDTHYYFQYGETAKYGSSTSSVDAGSGGGG